MAVIVLMDSKGLTQEKYDQANAMLGGKLPAGCLSHAAYAVPGGMHFVDVWEDPVAFQTFAQQTLAQMAAATGMTPPEVQVIPLHDYQHA